jgi:hypothetical protein
MNFVKLALWVIVGSATAIGITPARAADAPVPSQYMMGSLLPGRAPTASELLNIVPKPDDGTGSSLNALLSAALGGRAPAPLPRIKWGRTVTAADRALERCVAAVTDWDANMHAVTGTLQNRCNMSIRIQGSYGFSRVGGPCVVVDKINGVLLPPLGLQKLVWRGSDERAQQACIAAIDTLGVPRWPVELARTARDWIVAKYNGGGTANITEFTEPSRGFGRGTIKTATSDDLCVLTLTSPDYRANDGPPKTRTFSIRWADVMGVADVGYNGFIDLRFVDAGKGTIDWDLGFDHFYGTAAGEVYPTTAAVVLSEYCRAAEAPR